MQSADELLASVLKLPAEQRRRIARELVLSLDGADEGAEAAWGAEVEKRVRNLLDGKVETIDGEEAHRMVRARLRAIRSQ